MNSSEYEGAWEFFRFLPSISSIRELMTILRSDHSLLAIQSLSDLDSFIAGFIYGNSLQKFQGNFATLDGFTGWLQEKYSLSPAKGWRSIIHSLTESESDCLGLFWQLYDEYNESTSR